LAAARTKDYRRDDCAILDVAVSSEVFTTSFSLADDEETAACPTSAPQENCEVGSDDVTSFSWPSVKLQAGKTTSAFRSTGQLIDEDGSSSSRRPVALRRLVYVTGAAGDPGRLQLGSQESAALQR